MAHQRSLHENPFSHYLPIAWNIGDDEPVFSLTRNHGLRCRYQLHNINDPLNQNLEPNDRILISYHVNSRSYALFTVGDFEEVTYAFDEKGMSNLIGDLAERIARRILKRFLQRFDPPMGRIGGLFSKNFDISRCQGFIVAHSDNYVLKIDKYPNMILLKRTGEGKFGYQHVTDFDGLFDFRYTRKRHIVILESKTGKIDIDARQIYERLFIPLSELFPKTSFAYVIFASGDHLIEPRYPEYRILQPIPLQIYQELADQNIPSMFFQFSENDLDFKTMYKHLVTAFHTYHRRQVSFQGKTTISDNNIQIFTAGSKEPYLILEKREDGTYQVAHSPHFQTDEEDSDVVSTSETG